MAIWGVKTEPGSELRAGAGRIVLVQCSAATPSETEWSCVAAPLPLPQLRDRVDTFRHALAAHGHVSAQQSDSPSKHAYSERYTAPFLNLSAAEWGRLKNLPFCAGGLQGRSELGGPAGYRRSKLGGLQGTGTAGLS